MLTLASILSLTFGLSALPMTPRYASERSSIRSYRWLRIWLGVGVLLALALIGNSVRDYAFVARILSVQQVRHQSTQRIAAFERSLRANPAPSASRLKPLLDEMDTASQRPLWVVLRDSEGHVLEQVGVAEHPIFTQDQATSHFRTREPLFEVVSSRRGEAVVEVFPVFARLVKASDETSARPSGPLAVELAMPLASADAATLWPIRRNLIVNISAALVLLLTVGLAARGFRSYVRGKRLEQQVELARQVQSNLLPHNTQLSGGVRVAVAYQPADEVAGDFYDTFQTRLGPALVIGDVSGKGIPAALLMGVLHGAVRSSTWSASPADHEHETVELNHLLCERTSGERFASMFWSYCDAESGTLHYVNAGHCYPLLAGLRKGQAEIQRLETGGPVLGLLSSVDYKQGCVEIQPGDVMLLYSDGLVEATNASGEEFGESRLKALLSESLLASPDRIRDSILAGVRTFLGSESAHDDLTCLVAKFGDLGVSMP